MITKMDCIEIVGIKKHLDKLIKMLHKFGKVHLEKITITEGEERPFLQKVTLSEAQAKERKQREEISDALKDLILHLPKHLLIQNNEEIVLNKEKVGEKRSELLNMKLTEHHHYVTNVHQQLRSLIRKRKSLEDELQLLLGYKKIISVFKEIFPSQGFEKEDNFIGIILHKQSKHLLPLLEEELAKITHSDYKFIFKDLDGQRSIIILGFKKEQDKEIKEFIWGKGLDELKLPTEFEDLSMNKALLLMDERLKILPTELKKILEEIEDLFQKEGLAILLLKTMNLDSLNEFWAISSSVNSNYTFVVKGWVPEKSLEELRKSLQEEFKGLVVINDLHLSKKDYLKVPILLSNIKVKRPFERLLSLLPLPKYGTLDATIFMAIGFPLFFGLMLADIGYGLLLLFISRYILSLAKGGRIIFKDISKIVFTCALSSIIFGFVFGEFLGDLGERWGLYPLWCKREEAIKPLIMLAIFIGMVHIVLGLVLGVINSILSKNKKLMWDLLVRIIILGGVFLVVGKIGNILPTVFFKIGVGILIVFIPLAIKIHGFLAPLEIISTIVNILSYVRIAALGIASAVLALLANKLGGSCDSLFLGGAIFLSLHSLNFVLGVFSPTIQSIRLHYVEFLPKFYLTGGIRYQPFKKCIL
ncbi:hypothetical protein KJ997_01650 [bacterium]|nr:hypothetical protein [bacterium]